MKSLTIKEKTYELDDNGFLKDPSTWDEEFATQIAKEIGIGVLTEKHWEIINYLREVFIREGSPPPFYRACRDNSLPLHKLRQLFPRGYQRGACLVAGIGYMATFWPREFTDVGAVTKTPQPTLFSSKVYRVDAMGFLVYPEEWDESFAWCKAIELKIPDGLSERHWKVIRYLRQKFEESKSLPTVYETCEENGIDMDEMSRLFPDGYHRAAVKIAGLRLSNQVAEDYH